jgi:large subunit ribosomal protein L25
MSERPTLAAASRTVTGKKVATLRRDGRLPAVVYGHSSASESISLDAHEFDLLRRRVGGSTLVDLAVDERKAVPVLVHAIQPHPVTRRAIHVDLLAVRMSEAMTLDVALAGTGSAPAVDLGGTLVHPIETVKVRALPGDLPDSIHYDLGGLESYTITVADLIVPDGVTNLTDETEVVARVLPPRVEEVTAETEGEAPAAAEGEPAESGESGAGSEES